MNYFVLFLGLLLSGCIKTMGPTHLSFYVDVPKQEPSPSKAVFSSVVPTDGPDGVCIYKNGKCDYSDLDFLIKDLKKEFKSNYLATHYALAIAIIPTLSLPVTVITALIVLSFQQRNIEISYHNRQIFTSFY